MSLAGSVKLDPKKLEVPDLHGRLGDGELKLSMTARDYLGAADVHLDVNLSKLDLDRLMAVRQAASGPGSPGGAKNSSPPPAPPASSGPPMKARGQAVIGAMTYGNAKLDETKISWDLSGITPDLRELGGWAKLHVAGGTLGGSSSNKQRSGIVKALLFPLTVLQYVGKVLGSLVPSLNNLLFDEVVGDYVFSRGVMTIRDFHVAGKTVGIKTTGTADLAAQRLDLAASIGPVPVDITGNFENPSVRPRLTAILKAAPGAVNQATKLIKGLNKSLSIFKK